MPTRNNQFNNRLRIKLPNMVKTDTSPIKCYNSGAISSLTYLTARNNFLKVDRILDDLGMKPLNPMEVTWGIRPSAPWIVHMIKDILLLMGCHAVYFQRNWKQSRGALWEYKVARWLGKEMFFEKKNS